MLYIMVYCMVYTIWYIPWYISHYISLLYDIYHGIYHGIYHMVYTIWYIPIAAWYIPSKSGIYHETTFQMSGGCQWAAQAQVGPPARAARRLHWHLTPAGIQVSKMPSASAQTVCKFQGRINFINLHKTCIKHA